jgi:hypothetical protein
MLIFFRVLSWSNTIRIYFEATQTSTSLSLCKDLNLADMSCQPWQDHTFSSSCSYVLYFNNVISRFLFKTFTIKWHWYAFFFASELLCLFGCSPSSSSRPYEWVTTLQITPPHQEMIYIYSWIIICDHMYAKSKYECINQNKNTFRNARAIWLWNTYNSYFMWDLSLCVVFFNWVTKYKECKDWLPPL